MNVHQVVDYATLLNMTFVFVNQNLFSSIENFHEAVVTFQFLIHGLILSLVVRNTLKKVRKRLVIVHTLVVRAVHFHIQNVLLDNAWIITD